MSVRNMIEQHVNDLFTFEDILSTFLIRIDGVILFSRLPIKADLALINSIEWIKKTTIVMAREMQAGNLYKMIVELNLLNTIFYVAGSNIILVAITKKDANLGFLLIEIGRRARLIAKMEKMVKN